MNKTKDNRSNSRTTLYSILIVLITIISVGAYIYFYTDIIQNVLNYKTGGGRQVINLVDSEKIRNLIEANKILDSIL